MSDRCPTCNSDRHHGCTRNPRAAEGLKVDADIAQYHREEEGQATLVAELRAEVERLKRHIESWKVEESDWVAERDALKAELAKQSWAEETAKSLSRDNDDLRQQLAETSTERIDLRSRIEALAGRFEKCEVKAAPWLALRALLQSPKAETALDLILKWEKLADTDEDSEIKLSVSDLGKLRKLLEESK